MENSKLALEQVGSWTAPEGGTITLPDGRQLYAALDGSVHVAAEDEEGNTDPARREWVRGGPADGPTIALAADGRQLYVNNDGWAGVLHEGYETNTAFQRRHWHISPGGGMQLLVDGRRLYANSAGRTSAVGPNEDVNVSRLGWRASDLPEVALPTVDEMGANVVRYVEESAQLVTLTGHGVDKSLINIMGKLAVKGIEPPEDEYAKNMKAMNEKFEKAKDRFFVDENDTLFHFGVFGPEPVTIHPASASSPYSLDGGTQDLPRSDADRDTPPESRDVDGYAVSAKGAKSPCRYDESSGKIMTSDGRPLTAFIESEVGDYGVKWDARNTGWLVPSTAPPAPRAARAVFENGAGVFELRNEGQVLCVDGNGWVRVMAVSEASGDGPFAVKQALREWTVDEESGELSLAADGRCVYVDGHGRVCVNKRDVAGMAACTLDASSGTIVAPGGRRLYSDGASSFHGAFVFAAAEGEPLLQRDDLSKTMDIGSLWTLDKEGALTGVDGLRLLLHTDGSIRAAREAPSAEMATWQIDGATGQVALAGWEGVTFCVDASKKELAWYWEGGGHRTCLEVLGPMSTPPEVWTFDDETEAFVSLDGRVLCVDADGFAYPATEEMASAVERDFRFQVVKENENLSGEEIVDRFAKNVLKMTDEEIKEADEANEAHRQQWLAQKRAEGKWWAMEK
uniref:Uncharacterized protein n=1 Tax=Haptolina brevifila TaxID=156173 RepID=A0A7S2CKJ0_9EUKA